jgi:hypothetical protein
MGSRWGPKGPLPWDPLVSQGFPSPGGPDPLPWDPLGSQGVPSPMVPLAWDPLGLPPMGSQPTFSSSQGLPILCNCSWKTFLRQLMDKSFDIYIYIEREREREKLVYVYEYIYIFMYAHDILAKRELIRPPTRTFHCHPRQSLQSEFPP